MDKKLAAYLVALAVTLILLVYVLLNTLGTEKQAVPLQKSPLDFNQSTAPKTTTFERNLYEALKSNDYSKCYEHNNPDVNECLSLLDFSSKYCDSKNLNEKLFCLAFFKKEEKYCDWISLDWYSITCKAIIGKSLIKCNDIPSFLDRARCIKDLATNLEEADCNVLNNGWQTLCVANRSFQPNMCNQIKESEIKDACLSLFNE